MYPLNKIITCLGLIFLSSGVPPAQGWQGLVPLHSRREEVLRLLGPAQKSNGIDFYNLENEVVLISYSTGNCTQGGIWDVPQDTITRITVRPKRKVLLGQLQLTLSNYKVSTDSKVPEVFYYTSADEGIHIQTFRGEIIAIDYLPIAKEANLRCAKTPSVGLITRAGSIIDSHTLYASYGDIAFSKEKNFLNAFGRLLQEQPNAQGYIVVHPKRHMLTKRAYARANQAAKYLNKTYGIKGARIEIIKGEEREDLTINLYYVP